MNCIQDRLYESDYDRFLAMEEGLTAPDDVEIQPVSAAAAAAAVVEEPAGPNQGPTI